MDVKVSRKETRWQPDGPVEVLVDNIFDLYPVFGDDPAQAQGDGEEAGYSFRIVDENLILEWEDEADNVPDASLSGMDLVITADNADSFYLYNNDLLVVEGLQDYIVDIEMLDNDRAELLDRAMFALVKQRGQDPLELEDGIQWSEALIGEVSTPTILQQVHASVSGEGPGVQVVPSAVRDHLFFEIKLTNAV